MIKLSNRLACIAEQVPKGSRLADIGSDHALLPTFLTEQNIISFAVAGEINQGPYEAAHKQVEQAGFTDRISVRKGNGLQVVQPGEVDVINIAGMGGSLIVQILTEGKERLPHIKQLILQPNVASEFVRQWLINEHWVLDSEHILEEDGHIYEILVAHQAKAEDADRLNTALYQPVNYKNIQMSKALQLKLGPYLWREASPAFIQKWHEELEKLERVIHSIERSETEEAKLKALQLHRESSMIKEVIDCLQKDRP
jgi:tRNA (adenine22-N1)-methyltransferase